MNQNTNSRTFALLRPFSVEVVGDEFAPVFKIGHRINLFGGVEMIERKRVDGYFYGVINDVRFPRVECRVVMSQFDSVMTLTLKDSGKYTRPYIERCRHVEIDKDCQCCWVKWWRQRAEEEGINVPPLVIS